MIINLPTKHIFSDAAVTTFLNSITYKTVAKTSWHRYRITLHHYVYISIDRLADLQATAYVFHDYKCSSE